MGIGMIKGVILTPPVIITHPKGDVRRMIRQGDEGYYGVAEVYFSNINCGETKGWKKHKLMTLNLTVPFGSVRFQLFDDRAESKTKGSQADLILGEHNYQRLTVPPGIWMAFSGLSTETSIIANAANMLHDPDEALSQNYANGWDDFK